MTCHCPLESINLLSDLGRLTVLDLAAVLNLLNRVHLHGASVFSCAECTEKKAKSMTAASTQSAVHTLCAIVEACLPLLEGVCTTYNINVSVNVNVHNINLTNRMEMSMNRIDMNGTFDDMIFVDSLPTLVLQSKARLGQLEIEGGEMLLLVRIVVGRNLLLLAEMLERVRKIDTRGGEVEGLIRRCVLMMEGVGYS
ncbi:hypothetical protein ASPZODRAFT_2038743 [Penicilliopsis zonata CBS 506.65]|uniref:Uncharacterized protein n=1 Tax=Penicilliopsis zonata CBS 506.65 TaxID=1073090 RepID=A0A1L9SFY2_9EURO|nr:hypothetical protein ASPZODRAFT_2038743 [Penicilliopsis zonata CBS 506.65]OJJ46038.1 hypothetical protein ASPZODRAFT_2038743 [Penicilliopsis zonata CBS 506.65]